MIKADGVKAAIVFQKSCASLQNPSPRKGDSRGSSGRSGTIGMRLNTS